MIRIDFDRLRYLMVDGNAHMRRIVRTPLQASPRGPRRLPPSL
jgi:hypothetical protein